MKPFDLKKALAGQPVITRDGRKVHCVLHDATNPNEDMRVYARFDCDTGSTYDLYREDGLFGEHGESCCDLFMAPVKREGWVNVFPDGVTGGWHETKEIADKNGHGRIACVRIEWEE